MITPILHTEILLLSILLPEKPLPLLKPQAFGLVGQGNTHPKGLIGRSSAL
jgi:hypothetical protein